MTAEEAAPEAEGDDMGGDGASGDEGSAEEAKEEVKREDAVRKIVPGMVVRVHVRIKDVTPKGEERERIQVFEGTVIARKGTTPETTTITVRKVSKGIGVERIFPLSMPTIDKIEIVKQYRARKSKLYHLRNLKSKKKLKERPLEGEK